MKILITGAQGQLGHDLVDILGPGNELFPFDLDLDITDSAAVATRIPGVNPDIIIHSAAMTNVDGCETDPDAAYRVNAIGAQNVAEAARKCGAPMVYVSTDFVFDGTAVTPYTEFDPVNPISVYGKSKLAGENYVRAAVPNSFIVRTAWLYGKNGNNFVKTMLRLAGEQDEIKVVDDQVGSPTFSYDLALRIAELIKTDWYGTYHVTDSGSCSWYQFTKDIMEAAGKTVKISPITTADLGRPAPRPAFSVLDNYVSRLRGMTPMPDYCDALARFFE
jgi:dTDP-4-dehydrorhamnose reductase